MFYFIIRKIQKIGISIHFPILDGKITALINHWQRCLFVCLIVNKAAYRIILIDDFVDIFVEMRQQTNQISWRTCAEPIIIQPILAKGIQDAERIVDIKHIGTEVVTIKLPLQLVLHSFLCGLISHSHCFNLFLESRIQLLFRNATKCLIMLIHTDVVRLVETTKHAHLRKLGDTSEQDKL